MYRRFLIGLTALLAGLLLFPATPALADGDPPNDDGTVIWNEDYTLEEDEWLDGDLIVFNGDVTLEPGSRVEGSVIIWNGSAKVAGTVERDLVVSGGDIALGDSARVEGNVVCSWNCDIDQDPGARVDGGIIEGVPLPDLQIDRIPPIPRVPSLPTLWDAGPGRVLDWTLRAVRSLVAIVVIAAVAGLVALIWPQPTAQVGRAITEAPWPSMGIGLLTSVAGTALIVALAVTICLSPVAVLAALALSAAGLFGWIAVGAVVGERLMQALNVQQITPLWAAGLGALLITLIGTGLSAAFCLAPIGWLMIIALGCVGLGAVVLTRFGTVAYTASTSSAPLPPAPTPPPPAPVPPEGPVLSAVEGACPEPVEGPEPPEPPETETEAD
jgi:hypothetical protein